MDNDNESVALTYIDLSMLFAHYANQLNDYVQSNGRGQGIDLKVVDFLIDNIDRFGTATAKAIRKMQIAQAPQIKKTENSAR